MTTKPVPTPGPPPARSRGHLVRNLTPLAANTVLIQAITFVLRPTAIYEAIARDTPGAWLGVLGASFAVVPLALALPSGYLSDRFGERAVMAAGSVATLGSAVTFLLQDSLAGLVLATVLLGTGHLGCVVGQQALVANRADPATYDRAFGFYTFAASAGQAAGPALIVLFGGRGALPDTDAIFAWACGLSAVLALTVIALPRRTPEVNTQPTAGSSGAAVKVTVAQLLRRRGLVRALTVSCVVLAAVDISLVYLPALGAERSIAAGTIGALLTVRAVSSMASRLLLGRLSRLVGRGRLLTMSVLVAAASIALLPVPMPIWALILIVAVAGSALGVGQPLTMSWLAEATPPGARGRAMSLRLTGNRLGQVAIPSLAGAAALGAGASGVLWLTAAALGVTTLAARAISATPRAQPAHRAPPPAETRDSIRHTTRDGSAHRQDQMTQRAGRPTTAAPEI